jgi:hypothetical protein
VAIAKSAKIARSARMIDDFARVMYGPAFVVSASALLLTLRDECPHLRSAEKGKKEYAKGAAR